MNIVMPIFIEIHEKAGLTNRSTINMNHGQISCDNQEEDRQVEDRWQQGILELEGLEGSRRADIQLLEELAAPYVTSAEQEALP